MSPVLFFILALYLASILALLIGQLHRVFILNYVLMAVNVFCVAWIFAATSVIYKTVMLLEILILLAAFFFALIIYFITVSEFSVGGPFWFGTVFIIGVEFLLYKKYGAPWNNILAGIIVAIAMYGRLSVTRMIVRNLNKRYLINEQDYLLFSIGAPLDLINCLLFNMDLLTEQKYKMNDQLTANYNN